MAFNAKTASKLTGVTYRQLVYWDETHLIKPSISGAEGTGSTRLYSFTDLVQLRVARALKTQGVSLQKIRKAINWLRKNFPDIKKPLAEKRLITDGNTVFVWAEDREAALDVLAKGQLVMSIAVGQIIEDTKDEVARIASEKKYTVKVQGKAYRVVLHPDLEDGGFWVECPSLPGCSSQGDTVEEALDMIRDAISACLEVSAGAKRKGRASA
ncbi:MerR family transcriptional regulator [bacterium]|nr:MerR family transcriptional regulator [bacterium]